MNYTIHHLRIYCNCYFRFLKTCILIVVILCLLCLYDLNNNKIKVQLCTKTKINELSQIRHSLSLANIYLFKVNNGFARKRCVMCSKLTIKTQERHQNVIMVFLVVNFEYRTFFNISVVDFE